MPEYGMEIKKLVLQGTGRKDAVLNFASGLNVVAGASDTGKSFAFECINYILGATEIPELPNEAKGYEYVLLEFLDKSSNQTITLRRSLKESEKIDIYYIYADFDHVQEGNFEKLSADSKAKNSLSTKLLNLCNCPYRNVLRKSSNGETESFTFRKYVYLMMMNEARIVQKNSAIFISDTRRDKNSTKELSAFFTVLTGLDYQKYIKTESVEVKRAQIKGAIDELLLISSNLQKEITESEKVLESHITTQQVNEIIKNIQDSIQKQRAEIESIEKEREKVLTKINTLLSEKKRITDNVIKFRLLKKNYQSDIGRLDFIEQSHDYTGQLADVKCPVCDAEMTSPKESKEIYYIAIAKEKAKLQSHLQDLQGTIDDFEDDLRKIDISILEQQNIIKLIEDKLEKQTKQISKDLEEYENYQKQRDKVIAVQNNKKKLFDTSVRIQELNEKIDNTKAINDKTEIKRLSEELMVEFCDLIKKLLEDWNFINKLNENAVYYNKKDNDIIVWDKTKASYGKGARAIINSSFVISIMLYCKQNGLSHPGFVVLDSPLTTYKEKDKRNNEKNEEVSKSVKDSFFYSLAQGSKDCQIIIFDNETPPEDLRGITYHHFTGNPDLARTGFIPLV